MTGYYTEHNRSFIFAYACTAYYKSTNNIDAWIIKNIFYNSTIMIYKRKNLKYMYEGCTTKS